MQRRRHLRLVLGALLATAAVMVSGCSNGTAASSQGGSKETVRIGALYLDNQGFYGGIRKGIQEGAGDQKIQLLGQNSGGDASQEAQFMSTLVGAKVDAIVMSPVSDTASVPVVRSASQAQIPVVCYNTCLNPDDSKKYVGALVTTDQTQFGKAVGDFAGDYFNEVGNKDPRIAILNCDAYEACRQRKAGFKEALLAKVPGAQIVADQAGFEPDKAPKTAAQIITANPNIDAFYSTNDNGTIGALKGVQAKNHMDKTVIFGSDISVEIAQALLDHPKTLLATNAQNPQQMGKVAVQQALKLVNGEKVRDFTTYIPAKIYSSDKPSEIQGWLDAHKDGIP